MIPRPAGNSSHDTDKDWRLSNIRYEPVAVVLRQRDNIANDKNHFFAVAAHWYGS